jgi:hypothetical protein
LVTRCRASVAKSGDAARKCPEGTQCATALRIPAEAIFQTASSFEIIEEYPSDKYLPNYLIRGEYNGFVFHFQAAADVADKNIRIVPPYVPNPDEWDCELRRRIQA